MEEHHLVEAIPCHGPREGPVALGERLGLPQGLAVLVEGYLEVGGYGGAHGGHEEHRRGTRVHRIAQVPYGLKKLLYTI